MLSHSDISPKEAIYFVTVTVTPNFTVDANVEWGYTVH